jgi:hypothetical protein
VGGDGSISVCILALAIGISMHSLSHNNLDLQLDFWYVLH